MQLRKRAAHINYTDGGGSPNTIRPRRRNSAAFESEDDDASSGDSLDEGSSGLENSDSEKDGKKKLTGSKRKHGDGVGGNNEVNRNAWDSRRSASLSEDDVNHDEEHEVFVNPKVKKRKSVAEPRTRPVRSRKSENVNYKDATSSDDGDDESHRGGYDGSADKRGKLVQKTAFKDGSQSSPELSGDDDEIPGTSRSYNRKKGSSNGKMRRAASGETPDSPSKDRSDDGDVKYYARRSKNPLVVLSDDEDEPGEKMDLSTYDGTARHNIRSAKSQKYDGSDVVEEQLNNSVLTSNASPEKRPSVSYVVDAFGLRIGADDYGVVSKLRHRVEKILSVRNRASGKPIYCVKLQGMSYRNVVNLNEGSLQRSCSQLLRNFLNRMDALRRIDGNPGEHPNGPAFSPHYLRIDRIVAMEKTYRRTRFLVKWCNLPYTDTTWEREDDLLDDKVALRRYDSFNRKKKRVNTPISSNKLVFNDGRSLRDYQEEGVSWIHDKYKNEVNCILADEMGLGKTIQSVAVLETLRTKHDIRGPFLVVAPVSTLGHWQREVESLTDMNCVVYTGTQEDRETIRHYEFNYEGDAKVIKFNVLLTSFEMVMRDQNKLAKIDWKFIIVDEAHRLKSRDSKTSHSVKQMTAPRGGLLLLTGTPVQNNTKEIFSLLNLLDSQQFESEDEFLDKYGDLKNAEQVKDLQDNVLRPRLLRRMKEDVEKSIPQKEETIVWVEMTKEQWVYYRAIYENSIGVLLKGSSGQNIPSLRNVAMELRKVCNHPLLCDGVEDDLISKHYGNKPEHLRGEKDPQLALKLLQQSSGKMVLVDKLLPMLKEAGRRILIFSQFTMMLDLLEDYLNFKGYNYERIDGNVRGIDRQAAIDRYSAVESDGFVFLLSTRAGGLGITLTAADTCLIYDSDWNPQNDLQAMARCHRIGQTKDVKIYRLITRNTYEQKLFECSSRKYGLDEAILGNRLGADIADEPAFNIESLLKNGAYDMVKDDGEANAAEFSAQNIHEILEQRTQKRLIGGRGVNTFSVATFVSQSEMEQDPADARKQQLEKGANQFWHEMLPDACKASEKPEQEVLQSPAGSRRKRAQVRVNYREDHKAVSEDDETYDHKGSGRNSHTDDSSVSVESEEDDAKDCWADREVKRLEDRLTALGTNRTRQIQKEAFLEHRQIAQVEQVSEFLVQFCHYEATRTCLTPTCAQTSPGINDMDQKPDVVGKPPEVGKVVGSVKGVQTIEVQGILPKDCVLVNNYETGVNYRKDGYLLIGDTRRPTPPACLRLVMRSRYLVDRLSKNAARYLQILHERSILAHAIAKNDPRFLPPKVPIRSKKIPIWWGNQEDLDLMIGIHKHGHRDFKKIRMDPSLCFAKRMQVVDQRARAIANQHVNHQLAAPQNGMMAGGVNGVCANQNPAEGYPNPVTGFPNAVAGIPSPVIDDGVNGIVWPPDSVLAARLKRLFQLLPIITVPVETVKRIPRKEYRHRVTETSGNAEKRRTVAVEAVLKEVPPLKVPKRQVSKAEVAVEVPHPYKNSTISGKENETFSIYPLPSNMDKKEAVLENIRQQRITGYFIPKVAVMGSPKTAWDVVNFHNAL